MNDVWAKLHRRIKTATERSGLSPDEHGWRAGRNVTELRRLQVVIDKLIDNEIIRGHDQGAAWTMLGGTKQYTYGRYKRAVEAQATRERFNARLASPVNADLPEV